MFAVQAGFIFVRTIGDCIGSRATASFGNTLSFFAVIYAIGIAVYGSILRWDEDGTLCACYEYNWNSGYEF